MESYPVEYTDATFDCFISVFPNLATSIRYENVSKGFSKINKVQMKLNININERKISRKRFKLWTCGKRCCLLLGVVLSGKNPRTKILCKLEVHDTENRKWRTSFVWYDELWLWGLQYTLASFMRRTVPTLTFKTR